MNCPACDAPNPEGASTCVECGRELTATVAPAARSAPRSSDMAVASLISGILGWTLLPVLGALLAVVLGHMARAEIRDSQGRLDGMEIAAFGLGLGYSSLGLAALAIVAMVVLLLLGLVVFPLGLGTCALFGSM